jgi:hypothetical protein
VARFAWELRQLRARAGTPSYRDLAARAHYAPSTLADATRGHRLPTREVAVALACACGGDRDEWTRRWNAAAALARPDAPDEPSGTTGPRPAAARSGGAVARSGGAVAAPGHAIADREAAGRAVADREAAARSRRAARLLVGAGGILALLALLAAVAVAVAHGRRRAIRRLLFFARPWWSRAHQDGRRSLRARDEHFHTAGLERVEL